MTRDIDKDTDKFAWDMRFDDQIHNAHPHSLRVILGDQLNQKISSLADIDKDNDVIMMCEVYDEARYVKHHKKKIAFIFSAMRHFALELQMAGYRICYTTFDDPENSGSISTELKRALTLLKPDNVIITEPSEYRVLDYVKNWDLGCPVEIRPDGRFLCSHQEFEDWAGERKQFRMEYFYRMMRQKYNILMDGDKPVGGQWNYDSENRKPPKQGLDVPKPYSARPDAITQSVMRLVEKSFPDHFGDLDPFIFAVTRKQALSVLERFIQQRLAQFGDYQDAMVQGEPWMFHAHISFYINCGLLLPLECIEAAQRAYHDADAPLNAVEGFIRQILGWREYVRGIYWLKMPEYEDDNFLEAKNPLPDFFWGAPTQMNCLLQCVKETQQNAYAHHIQRLMVIGNFALIAGLDPKAVNEWFMIVYADAYQWVELPNVTGMILFADGGVLASKPYAASGAYINKMSNYCKSCRYKVSKKNGPEACPFNYLYWGFMLRNQDKLRGNPRLNMSYKTLDRMSAEKIEAIEYDSHQFFKSIE